jgi:flagellar motility protein MotE (MotC chaperone)
VSKKRIILTAVVGLVIFTGAFVFAWLTRPSAPGGKATAEQPGLADNKSQPGTEQSRTGTAALGNSSEIKATALSEQQLQNLIHDVRKQIQDYTARQQSLQIQEQRLLVAQDILKQDMGKLENLRVELVTITAQLKEQREKLLKSRVEIGQTEKANFSKIAATYDKMDPASAGKIISSMCIKQPGRQQEGAVESGDGNMADAVKILYYMSERTKAKVLAEMVGSEPALAASLVEKLKQVVEGR